MTSITLSLLLTCLSEFESADNDHAVGRRGEVSRYQIMPGTWRAWSRGGSPQDLREARRVACLLLCWRIGDFRVITGREPEPEEIYALWNAPGAFAKGGYEMKRLSKRVRARCERFGNLYRARSASVPQAGLRRDRGRR